MRRADMARDADEARAIARARRPELLALSAFSAREPDDALEASPEHALAVKGHVRWVHRLLELRILDDCLADALAVLLVLP